MKILATSDLHQMINKWKLLVETCKKDKFDVVVVAGDLLPRDIAHEQLPFIKHIKKYATKVREQGAKLVLILGNDDNQLMIPEMEKGHDEGLWYYIPEKVVEIDGYEFAAMPYVPDYPFGYKFWCRAESKENLRIDPIQFGDPLLIDPRTKDFIIIPDYKSYLNNHKSIWNSLVETSAKIKDISKSIWVIHSPPANMGLDVCARGVRVGSNSVFKFIDQYQPLLTIHGHIHESPQYSKKWSHQWGKTTCIQGGQIDFDLNYSTIEIEQGKITKMEHSKYGNDGNA